MAKQQTRQEWAKRIERWKDSGLTAAEFAAETGISAKSLSWWRWNLSADAKTQDVSPKPEEVAEPQSLETTDLRSVEPAISERAPAKRRRRRSKLAATMTFVEMTPPQRGQSLEVVVASGRHIRVPIGFDAPTFERLLGILERSA